MGRLLSVTNPDGGLRESFPSETFRYMESVRSDSFSQAKNHLFPMTVSLQEIPGCVPAVVPKI